MGQNILKQIGSEPIFLSCVGNARQHASARAGFSVIGIPQSVENDARSVHPGATASGREPGSCRSSPERLPRCAVPGKP